MEASTSALSRTDPKRISIVRGRRRSGYNLQYRVALSSSVNQKCEQILEDTEKCQAVVKTIVESEIPKQEPVECDIIRSHVDIKSEEKEKDLGEKDSEEKELSISCSTDKLDALPLSPVPTGSSSSRSRYLSEFEEKNSSEHNEKAFTEADKMSMSLYTKTCRKSPKNSKLCKNKKRVSNKSLGEKNISLLSAISKSLSDLELLDTLNISDPLRLSAKIKPVNSPTIFDQNNEQKEFVSGLETSFTNDEVFNNSVEIESQLNQIDQDHEKFLYQDHQLDNEISQRTISLDYSPTTPTNKPLLFSTSISALSIGNAHNNNHNQNQINTSNEKYQFSIFNQKSREQHDVHCGVEEHEKDEGGNDENDNHDQNKENKRESDILQSSTWFRVMNF